MLTLSDHRGHDRLLQQPLQNIVQPYNVGAGRKTAPVTCMNMAYSLLHVAVAVILRIVLPAEQLFIIHAIIHDSF